MSGELIKSESAIADLRHAGRIWAATMDVLRAAVVPGVTGVHIDTLARETIHKHGGKPAFLGFNEYQFSICWSVNDVVVHGLPNRTPLSPGDVVSIDLGVTYNGWHVDAAITQILEPAAPEDTRMVSVANQALDAGIAAIRDGVRLGDVQAAIQQTIDQAGYGNVTSLTGHGIGRDLHEPPSIPNVGAPNTGITLRAGMVICLEPMITQGSGKVVTDRDGWTIRTADHSRAAHVEHTILITQTGAEILTH